jgi:hypothetical protein
MRRLIVIAGAVLVMVVAFAGSALAQVPPHDHLLTVPGTGEQVQVAPPRCTLGETVEGAFLNFHFNVHLGVPTDSGGLTVTPSFC